MNSTDKLCRFCLIHVKDTYFDDLGELCDILSALNLKVNLDISEEPVICIDCIENLRKLFSFKVICVQSEDLLIPFMNTHINRKIDLQQVYLQINGSKSLGDKKVCRFCMCGTLINSSLKINTILEFMLPTMYLLEFFPELDIDLVKDPIICKMCHNFLQDHLTFIRKCMNIEENIQKYVELKGTNAVGQIDLKGAKQFIDKIIIQKEIEDGHAFKHEIQHAEIIEHAYSKKDKKMESYIQIENSLLEQKSKSTEVKSIMNSPERILDIASAESRKHYKKHFVICRSIKYSSAVTMHKYGVEGCLNKARYKLIHKDPSEVTMYKCEIEGCSFETKYKTYLPAHKLIHKNPSEVTMYKCEAEGCSYKTKCKNNLYQHKLRHKKLIHKRPSDVTKYKCGIGSCLYEAKRKYYLTKHKLIHKDASEVIMHKCGFEGCLFETKYINSLLSHLLIHKDPSEVTMYKCGFGDCSYETKYKGNLVQHKLIHKDVLEVMT